MTDEEMKSLEGTIWKAKLDEVPVNETASFKYFFKESTVETRGMSRQDISEYIADKLEDRYDLHFTHSKHMHFNPADYTAAKDFALSILDSIQTDDSEKNSVRSLINRSNNVHELLTRLCLAAS